MSRVFEDEFTLIQTDIIEACEKYADDKADIVYVYASYEDGTISCDYFYRIGTCLVERHKLNDISGHNYDTSIERQRECMGVLVEDMQKLIMLCKEYNKEMPTEIKLIYDTHNNKMDANYSYEEKYCFDEIKTADDISEEWFEEIKNMNWQTGNKMLVESSKITRKEIEKYINEVQKVERKKYGYLDRQIKKWKVISIVCWIATLIAGQRILYNVYDGIDAILYPFDPSYRVHSIINLIVVMVVLILIFALCLYGAIASTKKYKKIK